ncbi:MAG: dihydropteroate synthase [Nitrospirales bacterium]|nr:dihydropteroate synthase [Nitrospirales bacterium]
MPQSIHQSNRTQEWHCAGEHILSLGQRTLIMGILNVTPDSFSDGGRFFDVPAAVAHAQAMVAQGADVIDVGAESTKPGACAVEEQEEMRRLKPVLQALGKQILIPISVDTRKASVAQMALDLGVSIVNDVSALQFDAHMGNVVAEARAGVILMHMKGVPFTMQEDCWYEDVVQDVRCFLKDRLHEAEALGIAREQIVLDPGIGFAKKLDQNIALLAQLQVFQEFGRPLVVGVSNKSFIGTLTGKDVTHRLMGTAAAVTTAVLKGANIVRVHEVGDMQDVVRTAEALRDGHVRV